MEQSKEEPFRGVVPSTIAGSIAEEKMTSAEPTAQSSDTQPDAETQVDNYPHGISLWLICFGLSLGILCVSLDRSIIATAVPKITDEFDSLDDIGWYGSAYLLTSCCFQLPFGKIYAELNAKWVFLVAIAIFETGSIVCAVAPNSIGLILGRTIAGLGCAGINNGALTILAHSVPLHNRPKVLGVVAGSIGIAQVLAPTLGGVFTDYATWRWCFWINLPIGAVTCVVVLFLVHLPSTAKGTSGGSFARALQKFDLLGTLFLVPAVVCLLLALQWGGSQYEWGNWRLILTLSIFSFTIVIWGIIQARQGDRATVPVRIVAMRSMACAMWFIFCLSGALFVTVQFIPIWFQAVRNESAHQAGINFLAVSISQVVMAICTGFITGKIGYYAPAMVMSTVLSSAAAGMITLFGLDTSTGYWIGSLVLFGIGIGIGSQQSFMVPQTVLSGGDVALGTSIIVFAQPLGGTIFNSVANNILQSRLVIELAARAPKADPAVVVAAGANDLVASMQKLYPQDVVEGILAAYAAALQRLWLIPVILLCLGAFGSVFMEWRSVKKNAQKTPKGSG